VTDTPAPQGLPRAQRGLMEIENLQQFSDTLTFVRVCRVAQGARFRQSVDRNSFRSPRGERDVRRGRPRSVQPCPIGSTSMRTAVIRYTPRAVGLKPSAIRGKARRRGL
jgi:hypothetical protein